MKLDILLNSENIDLTIKVLGKKLNINWEEFDKDQFKKGLYVEMEHAKGDKFDVVHDQILTLAKIVLAHLSEDKEYYSKLESIEESKYFMKKESNLLENLDNLQLYLQDSTGMIAVVKNGNKNNAYVFDPKSDNPFKSKSISGLFPLPKLISHEEAQSKLGKVNYDKFMYMATLTLKEDCCPVASSEPNSAVGARLTEPMPVSASVVSDMDGDSGKIGYRLMLIYANDSIKIYPEPGEQSCTSKDELMDLVKDVKGYGEIILPEILETFF